MGVKDVNWCWWQVVDSLLGIGMGTALFWLPLYSRSSNLEVDREKLDVFDIVVSCSWQWQSMGFLTMFTIYLKDNRIGLFGYLRDYIVFIFSIITTHYYEFTIWILYVDNIPHTLYLCCVCVTRVHWYAYLLWFQGSVNFFVGGSSSSHDRHIIIE